MDCCGNWRPGPALDRQPPPASSPTANPSTASPNVGHHATPLEDQRAENTGLYVTLRRGFSMMDARGSFFTGKVKKKVAP